MDERTRARLLALNRAFYTQAAAPFDATRQGWTPGLLAIVPHMQEGIKERPLHVLDVGCGNARLARLLDAQGLVCDYTGVDASPALLDLARAQTRDLVHVTARFHQADLADPHWWQGLEPAGYHVVVCLATLQHLPGRDLRARVVADLARLARHRVILSCWQFLSSPRFAARCLDWTRVHLTPEDVEPGDALLPWKQGVEAVRYVHQVDERELTALAQEAGLRVVHCFRADGREGNLNLYAILEPGDVASPAAASPPSTKGHPR